MILKRFPQLTRYALLALALAGLVVSLIAPGWWLALPFAAMVAYLWRFSPRPSVSHTSGERGEPSLAQQRRNEPENYRSLEWKGMIFRSESEIKIAKAFDHRGIFFIPPARVRLTASKNSRMTRELDFVVCYGGKWGVLEVDGPFHDARADAERDALLRAHGIASIQRFPSLRCFQEPGDVVEEFLHGLK